MHARIFLCIIALVLAAPIAARAEEAIAPDIGVRVVRDYVSPTLRAFSQTSGRLKGTLDDLCRDPSPSALEAARIAFAETVGNWGHVSVLRFGPLAEGNRFERVFFWPDPRGVTLRQVQGLLGSKDALPADIAAESVALQGLPALDYVLFGTGAEKLGAAGGDERRCRYGAAVAGNVAGIAEALIGAWGEGTAFHAAFTAPAADRDPYRSVGEVAAEIVKAAGTALQFTRNAELLPALGDAPQKANGRRAPFWRSRQSFAFAAAQLDGVKQLVEAAGFVEGPSDTVNGYGRGVVFDVGHARDALLAVAGKPEEAFAEEEDRARIAYAAVAMEGAKHMLNGELSGALGLVMGFNALDGD
ncbi:imelysin family protein [Nitratireductor sp. ZSWI3]|uniref:imelysin family protein n=1 Tax=Nitratireductor sp. ZSWI3 TaxID=2966359 RepID=UPI00214FD1D7|nr:imelysin family protein [Nitratireductor sp. ZSWI3]MCR4267913.1 imelysin family protein [Nitratireductor sp. ZSWI3]